MVMIIPKNYKCELGVLETQKAIKNLKDFFQSELSKELSLLRVSSPLFVLPETGTEETSKTGLAILSALTGLSLFGLAKRRKED